MRPNGAHSHLPEDYLKAFDAFVPKDSASFIEDTTALKPLEDLHLRWKSGTAGNAAAIVGAPGSAAPFVRDYFRQRFSKQLRCTSIELDRFAIDHDGLAGALGSQLGVGRSVDVADLLKALAEADRQIVFLDRCHDLFRRRVNGFAPLFELQHLMGASRGKVLWVLLWTPYTWYYLDRTVGLTDHFDAVLSCKTVRGEILERWIKLKHEATGFAVDFGEIALERDEGHWLPNDLRDPFATAAEGDFESASSVWLSAARPTGEKKIRVDRFLPADPKVLDLLAEEDIYLLGSLLFHQRISLEALADDLNLTVTDTRRHINNLANRKLVVVASDAPATCWLEASQLPNVVRFLDRKNLINVKEKHGS